MLSKSISLFFHSTIHRFIPYSTHFFLRLPFLSGLWFGQGYFLCRSISRIFPLHREPEVWARNCHSGLLVKSDNRPHTTILESRLIYLLCPYFHSHALSSSPCWQYWSKHYKTSARCSSNFNTCFLLLHHSQVPGELWDAGILPNIFFRCSLALFCTNSHLVRQSSQPKSFSKVAPYLCARNISGSQTIFLPLYGLRYSNFTRHERLGRV